MHINKLCINHEPFFVCYFFIKEIQADLKKNLALFSEIQACMNEIESQFVPDAYNAGQFQGLLKKVTDLRFEHDDLVALTQTKHADSNTMHECGLKYSQLKSNFDKWIQSMEVKIHAFEPIAIDVEIVEGQYEQLQTAINEYEQKASDLDELNGCANAYLTLASAGTRHYQVQPATVKLNIVSKLKRRNSSTSSRHSSTENLSATSDSSLNNFTADLEYDLKKTHELHEWIGERLDDRKKDLLHTLDQMKSYLQDLHTIDNRLNQLETNLIGMFNLDEQVKLNSDLTTVEVKMPLEHSLISQTAAEFRQMDAELSKFNLDIEAIKVKGKQFIYDRLTNDTCGVEDVKRQLKELNDKYCQLNSVHASFKDKLEQFCSNFNSYKQNYEVLTHNLEQKQQMLNIMRVGAAMDGKNLEKLNISSDLHLIETQIKQIELLKSDLVKQDSGTLDVLNRNGEYLLETGLNSSEYDQISSQLKKLNNDYDTLSYQLNTTLNFKHKLRELSAAFTNQRQKFYERYIYQLYIYCTKLICLYPGKNNI